MEKSSAKKTNNKSFKMDDESVQKLDELVTHFRELTGFQITQSDVIRKLIIDTHGEVFKDK